MSWTIIPPVLLSRVYVAWRLHDGCKHVSSSLQHAGYVRGRYKVLLGQKIASHWFKNIKLTFQAEGPIDEGITMAAANSLTPSEPASTLSNMLPT